MTVNAVAVAAMDSLQEAKTAYGLALEGLALAKLRLESEASDEARAAALLRAEIVLTERRSNLATAEAMLTATDLAVRAARSAVETAESAVRMARASIAEGGRGEQARQELAEAERLVLEQRELLQDAENRMRVSRN